MTTLDIAGSNVAASAARTAAPPDKGLRAGALGLLATFAVALLFHAAHGQLGTPLLIYAAGVLFVMVHGPVPLHAHGRDAR